MKYLLIFKITVTVFLITFNNISFSQKEKGCVIEKDSITNENIYIYYGKFKVEIFRIKPLKNNNFELKIDLGYQNGLGGTIEKGSDLVIKFEDGSTIEKKTLSNSIVFGKHKNYRDCRVPIEVNKKELEKLSNSKIASMRYPDAQGGYLTQGKSNLIYKVYFKWLEKGFKEGIPCLFENID